MSSMRRLMLLLVAVLLLAPAAHGSAEDHGAVPRMTKEELKQRLGNAELVLLDVRLGGEGAPTRIPGAVFEDPDKVDAWASRYPKDGTIVLYCA